MDPPKLHRTRRHLPHWDLAGSTYFITARIKQGTLTPDEQQIILDHLRAGDPSFYRLLACVVMPDHIHLLIRPNEGITLSRMMQGIKGVSARLINQHRQTAGPLWRGESYDRIVRDLDEGLEKAQYIYNNPLRAGLVNDPKDYPYTLMGNIQ